ncbi:ABC transporter ATP-binding protein [Archaeoglobus neptunius]|uniref:ABC transporter ATP-binding protein n=1 Tax=Archaeoglobus neptunius TaxID=2798580 RepID=UPI001927011B
MLEVSGISKKYGDFLALKDLSFTVERGEVLGIIGENGAGKSTTLKILAGLIDPDSGEVRYFGKRIDNDVKRRLSYLPEIDALYDNMFVSEYLRFFADIYGVENPDRKIQELMEKLSLQDRLIGNLSKGMRRKVSIARTLIHNPDVLIYDEPTGGLDPSTSLMVANLMRELAESGKIIVFSAHNMFYVEKIADKVIIMKGGRALYYGGLRELMGRSAYIIEFTIDGRRKSLEVSEVDELVKTVEKIRQEGGTILEIDREVPRLENVYFALMSGNFKNVRKVY